MQQIIESIDYTENKIFEVAEAEESFIRSNLGQVSKERHIDAQFFRLLSPLPRPHRNVFCVGKNYVRLYSNTCTSSFLIISNLTISRSLFHILNDTNDKRKIMYKRLKKHMK
jgi:2-keto-4-pentenoate hydratase/2-oxohepta-3-ene-1,7-dioic acid hydratase in catechol pathway